MWFTPIPHIIGEGLENERGSEGELKRIGNKKAVTGQPFCGAANRPAHRRLGTSCESETTLAPYRVVTHKRYGNLTLYFLKRKGLKIRVDIYGRSFKRVSPLLKSPLPKNPNFFRSVNSRFRIWKFTQFEGKKGFPPNPPSKESSGMVEKLSI
jgi:hypothetical protein